MKKGLSRFKIENIGFDRLATDGWRLQQDTLARQDRLNSMSQKEWETTCISGLDLPGFEVFGALLDGQMAAAAIVCRIDNIYCVPYAMSHSRFLRDHVNNALFFSMSCELLNRENTSGIFFTVESLDAPPHVDEFKLRMGFKPVPVRQNVVLNPLIPSISIPAVHSLICSLQKQYPSASTISKIEGMLRFYREGKRPNHEQSIPECIKNKIEHSETVS